MVARLQAEGDHAGADRLIGDAVDQNETAEIAAFLIGRIGDGAVERQIAETDLVQLERLAGKMLHGVDVDRVLELGDDGGNGLVGHLQQIGAFRQERLVMHPDNVRGKLVGHFGRSSGRR